MASLPALEWTGIRQFPAATQTKLLDLLGKLKQENVSTLTILVMGKGGVGKSSTVNSLLNERVAAVSAFQSEGMWPIMCSRTQAGFTINIIDTPGLVEGGFVSEHALEIIKRFKSMAITDSFGKQIWQRGLVVLTHGQLSPPDGLAYEEFLAKRLEAILRVIRLGARIGKQEFQDCPIPVVVVENSGRCNTNEISSEKVLPNGTTWLPDLVKTVTVVISNGSKSIVVDKKLIEGPKLGPTQMREESS